MAAAWDMPNEPAESNFKSKVKATARRTGLDVHGAERYAAGLHPLFETNMLPEGQYQQAVQRECNCCKASRAISTPTRRFCSGVDYDMREAASCSARQDAPYATVDTPGGVMYSGYRETVATASPCRPSV